MEEYTRDSLRTYRREASVKSTKNRGKKWLTAIIIFLFIFATVFFFLTQLGIRPLQIKKAFSKWGEEISSVFKEENDVTETVDAVLAEQHEAV